MTVRAVGGVDDMSAALALVLVACVAVGILVLGVSAVSRRLLGITVGPLRAVVAGAVGVGSLLVFDGAVRDERDFGALSVVQIPLALFTAMVVLVLVEVFVPYGGWARPLRLVRGAGARLRRAHRVAQISRIMVRHGLGKLLRGQRAWELARRPGPYGAATARAARCALEECGGAMVKLGQALSTRHDLMPAHFIEELSRLQSDVPSAPWPEVEAVLHKELGKPVAEVFEWIEHRPLASASIAQVHRARLRDGPTVVVKVQRPGARESVERDLEIVLSVCQSMASRLWAAHAFGLRDLGDGFAQSVHEELDFRIEARNSAAVAEARGGYVKGAAVRIPQVHCAYTSARVLVQEWLEGVTLDSAGPIADDAGVDRHAAARSLLNAMLYDVLHAGVFHADPHPGNVLLLDDGRIGLLDFGSVGRIGPSQRSAIQELLVAVDRSDPPGLHDALLALLGVGGGASAEPLSDPWLLERELGRFMARHLGAGAQPDPEMFGALFQMLSRFGLAVPPEVAAVFRALATLEGSLTQFAPGFNLLAESREFAAGMLTKRLRFGTSAIGPGAEGEEGGNGPLGGVSSLTREAAREFLAVLPMLRRLPRRAERIGAALEQGRLGVRVRILADERERRFVSGLIHQLMVTFLAACTGLMGVVLLVFGTGRGPHATDHLELYPLIGLHLLGVSAILMLRVLYTAMRGSSARR